MKYEIEDGYEIPKTRSAYPFAQMKIGQSFFFDGGEKGRGSAASAAFLFSARHPEYKFAIRKCEGGFRCWRIEPKTKTPQ